MQFLTYTLVGSTHTNTHTHTHTHTRGFPRESKVNRLHSFKCYETIRWHTIIYNIYKMLYIYISITVCSCSSLKIKLAY